MELSSADFRTMRGGGSVEYNITLSPISTAHKEKEDGIADQSFLAQNLSMSVSNRGDVFILTLTMKKAT